MNLLTTLTAAVDLGHKIVFSLLISGISLKPGTIEFILPRKQARFALKVSQFIRKCNSYPICPEVQNPQTLEKGGIGAFE